MHLRNRVPVIFSLSMLDMLCCALGAVIFLMILNMWDARRQAKVLAIERKKVDETVERLTDSQSDLEKSQTDNTSSQAKARALEDEVEKTKGKLAAAEKGLEEARQTAAESDKARSDLASETTALRKQLDEQQTIAKSANERLEEAKKDHSETAKMAALVPGLQNELADATKRAKTLEADLEQLRKQAENAGTKFSDAQKQSQALHEEVASLRKQVDEQKETAGRMRRQLTDADERFAGVDLSGKRVICLVDISGSMGSRDANTLDPNKWPEVCRSVVKVLRSLPDITHFQVILFSTETQFLLGKPGEWLTFDRDISPDAVAKALARVQPQGDTNLYAAFDAAFRFRPQGLDAVYLFSDGLPNAGPGLPADPPRDEYVQSTMLGNHLRETIRVRWNAGNQRVRIHAIGFFYESPNLGAFLWALARENDGSFVGMSRP
jgi:hypothetical protein